MENPIFINIGFPQIVETRDSWVLPHPLKLEMEQRLWVPNSVCTSRCYCFAFIHIKVSFKTTQSMCELCWRLLLFSCMLGAIKCNNSIKNRHGEKILSFATSTQKWKWEKSWKMKAIMPWPGFEPGLLRPQRRVLTTRRSRLTRDLVLSASSVGLYRWYIQGRLIHNLD